MGTYDEGIIFELLKNKKGKVDDFKEFYDEPQEIKTYSINIYIDGYVQTIIYEKINGKIRILRNHGKG